MDGIESIGRKIGFFAAFAIPTLVIAESYVGGAGNSLFCLSLFGIYSFFLGRIAWKVPLFFFAQSVLAFTLLELVNHVEHYGIPRREVTPGRYERVNPLHSWNASHILSNFFLFQLQRHSDHHAFAHKRYQILNHYDESPQLMNPRLEQWTTQPGKLKHNMIATYL